MVEKIFEERRQDLTYMELELESLPVPRVNHLFRKVFRAASSSTSVTGGAHM